MDPLLQSNMNKLDLNGFFVYYHLNIVLFNIFVNKQDLIAWFLVLFPSHYSIFGDSNCREMQSIKRLLLNPLKSNLSFKIDYTRDEDKSIKTCRQFQQKSEFVDLRCMFSLIKIETLHVEELKSYTSLMNLSAWISSRGKMGIGPEHSDFRLRTSLYRWTLSREVGLQLMLF